MFGDYGPSYLGMASASGAVSNIDFIGSGGFTGHRNNGGPVYNFSSLLNSSGGTPTLLENDLVIISYNTTLSTGSTNMKPSDYTYIAGPIGVNSSGIDITYAASYKRMGASPDSSFSIGAPGGSAQQTYSGSVLVLRGVDLILPFDGVTPVTASDASSAHPNPGAVTPNSPGSWIIVCACAAGSSWTGANILTNPGDLSPTTNLFKAVIKTDTATDTTNAIGAKTDWVSGSFNPAQLGGGAAASSAGAVTFVLKSI